MLIYSIENDCARQGAPRNRDQKLSKPEKIPSPCIDICKDKRGVCIACGRASKDRKAWKKARTAGERLALIEECIERTREIGTHDFWMREYRRKCRKKGVPCPVGDGGA